MNPPPGVLRAAKIIASESIDIETSAKHFAEIIDRETVARELLEALKDLLWRVAEPIEYGPGHAVTKARAAIAKAEGRQ